MIFYKYMLSSKDKTGTFTPQKNEVNSQEKFKKIIFLKLVPRLKPWKRNGPFFWNYDTVAIIVPPTNLATNFLILYVGFVGLMIFIFYYWNLFKALHPFSEYLRTT